MRLLKGRSAQAALVGMALAYGGCGLLLGLDEFKDAAPTAGAGGSAGATSGSAGGGGSRVCEPGTIEACPYGGPPMTEGIGQCVAGSRTCLEDGSGYGECSGEVRPEAEDCYKRGDEDCDGNPCSDVLWSFGYGNGNAWLTSAALDSEGSIIVAGTFQGTLPLGTMTLEAVQGVDYFVAKLDNERTTLWAKRLGGLRDNGYNAKVTVDRQNNIAIAGELIERIDVDGISLRGPAEGSGPGLFAISLSPTGQTRWAKAFGSNADEFGEAHVTTTSEGDVIIAGAFFGNANFGATTLTSNGLDSFITRLAAADGSHRWSSQVGDVAGRPAGGQEITAVSTTSTNRILAVGKYSNSIEFGNTELMNSGQHGFLVEISESGIASWSRNFSGCAPTGVIADADDNSIVTGALVGTTDFGGGSTLSPRGDADIFVAKYGDNGVHHWSKSYGEFNTNRGLAVTTGPNNSVIAIGVIQANTDFGGGIRTGSPPADTFLLKLDRGGVHQWSKAFGDSNNSQTPTFITTYPNSGDVIIAIRNLGTIDFGDGRITNSIALARFAP